MISFLAMAAVVAPADRKTSEGATKSVATLTVSARIVKGQQNTERDWFSTVHNHRREAPVRQPDGQWVILRLIEHE